MTDSLSELPEPARLSLTVIEDDPDYDTYAQIASNRAFETEEYILVMNLDDVESLPEWR